MNALRKLPKFLSLSFHTQWRRIGHDGYEPIDFHHYQLPEEESMAREKSVWRQRSHWFALSVLSLAVSILTLAVTIAAKQLQFCRLTVLHWLWRVVPTTPLAAIISLLWWSTTAGFLALLGAVMVVGLNPSAGGSGMPGLLAYFNGLTSHRLLSLKTFLVKTCSTILSCSSGLPLGLEAPLIHLGAITGVAVTGHHHPCRIPHCTHCPPLCQAGIVPSMQNPREERELATAGVACGVSAVFGAPIGGLLFAMEEVSGSVWDIAMTSRVFIAGVFTFVISALLNTTISWSHNKASSTESVGVVAKDAAVMLGVDFAGSSPLQLQTVPMSLILGILCGALAALFTRLHLSVFRWRQALLLPKWHRPVLESTLLASVFAFLMLLIPMVLPCHRITTHQTNTTEGTMRAKDSLTQTSSLTVKPQTVLENYNQTNSTITQMSDASDLSTFLCSSSSQYSPFATLSIKGDDKSAIRSLFSRKSIHEWSIPVLLAFGIFYYSTALFASESVLSGGLMLPSIVIGAVIGRVFGLFLIKAFAHHSSSVNSYSSLMWIDPGVFALIGSSAFFAGMNRTTFSSAVIMAELSGELHYLLPIMVAVVTARVAANFLTPPFYQELLSALRVPFMPAEPTISSNQALTTIQDIQRLPKEVSQLSQSWTHRFKKKHTESTQQSTPLLLLAHVLQKEEKCPMCVLRHEPLQRLGQFFTNGINVEPADSREITDHHSSFFNKQDAFPVLESLQDDTTLFTFTQQPSLPYSSHPIHSLTSSPTFPVPPLNTADRHLLPSLTGTSLPQSPLVGLVRRIDLTILFSLPTFQRVLASLPVELEGNQAVILRPQFTIEEWMTVRDELQRHNRLGERQDDSNATQKLHPMVESVFYNKSLIPSTLLNHLIQLSPRYCVSLSRLIHRTCWQLPSRTEFALAYRFYQWMSLRWLLVVDRGFLKGMLTREDLLLMSSSEDQNLVDHNEPIDYVI